MNKNKLILLTLLCGAVSAQAAEKYGLSDGWNEIQESLSGAEAMGTAAKTTPDREIVSMPGVDEPELQEGWQELRSNFFKAEPVKDLESLLGVYSGRLHPLYEREDYTVPFGVSIYRAASGEVLADFPMPPDGKFETVKLKLTPYGAEFADAWGGRARLVIRRSGGRLFIFSNLYSDETYGVAEKTDADLNSRGNKAAGRVLATSYSLTSGQVTQISPYLFVMGDEVFSYYQAKFLKDTVSGPLWFRKNEVRFENTRVFAGGQAIADCKPDGQAMPGFKCAMRPGVGLGVKELSDNTRTFVLVKK